MRLTRGVLLVAATALTPALLLTGPAFAADSAPAPVAATAAAGADDPGTPVDEMSEHELRAAILTLLGKPYAGKRVTRDANAALDGTLEDMRTFLKTGYRLAQYEDDKVALFTILGKPYAGKRVKQEIYALLDAPTPEKLRTWLETGYRLAQYEDDKVALFTILGKPYAGKRVKQEIYALLDAPTPEKLRTWLETGYRLAQAEDDRVAVARILADPDISDALRAAAEEVIDGTPEELRYFLETGRYEVDE
ncbi:ALF repeat-containing protein [Streptomyces heliomycini]|uniref:ALF repeat-containing protein n=5 Tax=Streptomyces TaxID=1883 RepID=A0ABV5LIK3_9ACTN